MSKTQETTEFTVCENATSVYSFQEMKLTTDPSLDLILMHNF
jgi:hypothetical protein